MTNQELREMGQALYGRGWKLPMAEALGLHRHTLAKYAKDGQAIPSYVEMALVTLKARRREELA